VLGQGCVPALLPVDGREGVANVGTLGSEVRRGEADLPARRDDVLHDRDHSVSNVDSFADAAGAVGFALESHVHGRQPGLQ